MSSKSFPLSRCVAFGARIGRGGCLRPDMDGRTQMHKHARKCKNLVDFSSEFCMNGARSPWICTRFLSANRITGSFSTSPTEQALRWLCVVLYRFWLGSTCCEGGRFCPYFISRQLQKGGAQFQSKWTGSSERPHSASARTRGIDHPTICDCGHANQKKFGFTTDLLALALNESAWSVID